MMIQEKIDAALALLDKAVAQYQPKLVVALMSGGDDSLPATYIGSLHPAFSGVLHINTGIGIDETREHVRSLCVNQNWKLWEYKATENTDAQGDPDPQTYEDIVLQYGFPGRGQHAIMYARLKERQLRRFERDMAVTSQAPVLYISGAREQESQRRMLTVPKTIIQKEGRQVWINVIHNWSRSDCANAREFAKLPRNEVSALLHMSGECLCGAFGSQNELREIEAWYPKTGAYIRNLEEKVLAAGFPWRWGENPPQWWIDQKRGQLSLFGGTPESEQFLCLSCNKRGLSPDQNEAPRDDEENRKSGVDSQKERE